MSNIDLSIMEDQYSLLVEGQIEKIHLSMTPKRTSYTGNHSFRYSIMNKTARFFKIIYPK